MHSGADTRCPVQKGWWHIHSYTHVSLLTSSFSLPLSVSIPFPSSTFHSTLHLSRLNSRPCINYLVMSRVPRLVRNLCDLFRPRSHSPPHSHNLPPAVRITAYFFRIFFEFPLNDRIKSSLIANYNETNYLYQLETIYHKKKILNVSWDLVFAFKFNREWSSRLFLYPRGEKIWIVEKYCLGKYFFLLYNMDIVWCIFSFFLKLFFTNYFYAIPLKIYEKKLCINILKC